MADNRPVEETQGPSETKASSSPITDKPKAKTVVKAKPTTVADGAAKADGSITKSPKGKTDPAKLEGDAKADAVTTKPKGKAKKEEPVEDGKITGKPKLSLFGMNLDFSDQGPPGVWGIDLGQCALKALRLEMVDGVVTATAFDYIEHPKILSQPDADPDQLTREALEKFLSRNNVRGDEVAISVPGQSGLARFVKLPPVEEKKIADIVRFEAKQQIPFNLDEVVWDYQKIGSGEVIDGLALDSEIGLFAMKRDMVNRYLQHFKDVGVEVHIVQMAPLALCNFLSFDMLGKDADAEANDSKKQSLVALDIGADSSNLVITDGGRIIWQRPIPLGGNHFTRALTKDMKLTFAKAEHLKRNALQSPDLKKILTAIKPVLNDFVGEVQRSLGFFTNTHRDAEIEQLIGLGNAFRLPGLQKYLEEKLSLKVLKLGKLNRLVGDEVVNSPMWSENLPSFAVAYGLALQGLKQSRLHTNLLPGEIRTDRIIRGKKPWAVAGAAALLIGLGSACLGAYFDGRAYGDKSVADAIKKADEVKSAIAAADGAYNKAKENAAAQEKGVKSIVAGQAEQRDWLALSKFIGEAIPQPYPPMPELPPEVPSDRSKMKDFETKLNTFLDGHHLPQSAMVYWNEKTVLPGQNPNMRMTGRDAAKALLKRQRTADSDGKRVRDELGEGIDDLIQFNIVAVNTRYCDDLEAFWKNVAGDQEWTKIVRPKDQRDKPPTGKGWVVELQGYTWHHGNKKVLEDVLVENLQRVGMPDYAPEGGDKNKAAAAPSEDKPKEETPKPEERILKPVLNRIDHITLLETITDPLTEAAPFTLIGQSRLDQLMGSGILPAGGANLGGRPIPGNKPLSDDGGGGGNTTGAPANPRDGWAPLSSGGGLQRHGRPKCSGRKSRYAVSRAGISQP